MDELVKLVSEKTGLPAPQAKMAVETVLNFLKQKLPPQLAGQVDSLVNGGGLAGGLGGLTDLLGGKQ